MPTSLLEQLDNDSIVLMYLAGELSAEDSGDVERMLANDAGLRAKLDTLRDGYDAVSATFRSADAGERMVLSAGTAARRVGQAARTWHAERAASALPDGPGASAARRRLRFPWWAYPLASAAALVLAAVSWWGFQPDNGPVGKRLNPVQPLVFDMPDAFPLTAEEQQRAEEMISRTWENYAAVTSTGEEAEAGLDEAEDELYALLEPGLHASDDFVISGESSDEQ